MYWYWYWCQPIWVKLNEFSWKILRIYLFFLLIPCAYKDPSNVHSLRWLGNKIFKENELLPKQIKDFIAPNNHGQIHLRKTTDGKLDDPLKVS